MHRFSFPNDKAIAEALALIAMDTDFPVKQQISESQIFRFCTIPLCYIVC